MMGGDLQPDTLPDARGEVGEGRRRRDRDTRPAEVRSVWGEAEARAMAVVRRATGNDLGGHLAAELAARPGANLLAIGAGAGAVAVELVSHVRDSALVCIDGSVRALEAIRRRARELGLQAQFAELDLDQAELERGAFDLVFSHAALHQVRALERVADRLERTLRPGGALVIVDVICRSDYGMWPETREVARNIFATLPARFRLNHTAHAAPLIDDEIWQPDPMPNAAPASRSEDILPVLSARFARREFVPYFSLCRRFFDSMYGPNYDLEEPLDKAVFDWIWELDLHHLATRRLRPETFFGLYRRR